MTSETLAASNRHRLAELRSLAYHRAVAERLRAEPTLLGEARARLDHWEARAVVSREVISRWRSLIEGPIEDLESFLTSDTEQARELRQSTPFAGIVSARARWRIWEEVARTVGA